MMLTVFILATAALMAIMAGAWAIHRASGNAGWIDAMWTFGTGLTAAAAALAPLSDALTQRQIIVAILAAVWSLRLGADITRRNLHRPDDPRYAKMAVEWGADANRNFFWLLQKQAWCGAILIAGVFVAAHRPGVDLRVTDIIGIAILLGAVLATGIADRQLRRFAADPANRGGVCDIGLWRYSRHPNYFFEWLGWMAYPVIAIDLSGTYSLGWVALLAPVLMYWLLVYISGIPPLEDQMIASRGALYERYRERTNSFFPGPRKQSARTS